MDAQECINSRVVGTCRHRYRSGFSMHFSKGLDNMPSLPGCFHIHKPVINRYIVSGSSLPMSKVTKLLTVRTMQLILTVCL